MAKRCASSRTCCNRCSASSRGYPQRVRLPGHVHLFEPLGQGRDRDLLQAELFEHAYGYAELPLPAVDDQEVGRVCEALALAGAFVALLEVTAEPAGEHLLHRGEVVLALLPADLEAPVVGALREAVLHDDHRSDDLGSLKVRDVETLDPERRLGRPSASWSAVRARARAL